MSITHNIDLNSLYDEISNIKPQGVILTPIEKSQRLNCIKKHVDQKFSCVTCNVDANFDDIYENVDNLVTIFHIVVVCPSCNIRGGIGISVNN
jgi:hypothetical protein